jgi:hypothetical protein
MTVSDRLEKLRRQAQEVNEARNDLGVVFADIESELKRLNLGVPCVAYSRAVRVWLQ